jgi:hypothetical protein
LGDIISEPGSRPRVGADDIERLVVEVLCQQQSRLDPIAELTTGAWTSDIRELVRTSVDRIVVHYDWIELTLKRKRIDQVGDNQAESSHTLKLALPTPRPRARKQILVPGNSGTQRRRVDHALVLALARARSWMRMLRQGEFVDTSEIAQSYGFSEPHVRRLLRFAYLAPDIVQAIVEGRQPRTLTVKRLLQGIPLDWSDQRAAFGAR